MFGARVDMAGALQVWKSRAPPKLQSVHVAGSAQQVLDG
jgi:hypothetical protein